MAFAVPRFRYAQRLSTQRMNVRVETTSRSRLLQHEEAASEDREIKSEWVEVTSAVGKRPIICASCCGVRYFAG